MRRLAELSVTLVALSLVLAGCGGTDDSASPRPSSSDASPQGTPGYAISGAKAQPDYTGPGAAGVCPVNDGEIASVSFEQDVPSPRCLVVSGPQRLRVTNNLEETVVARLGGAEINLPAGSTVTLVESFSEYLEPGGYYLKTDVYGGGGMEIRFQIG